MSRTVAYGWRAAAVLGGAGLLLSGACAGDEVLRPAPVEAASVVSSSSGSGAGGGSSFTPRTVIQRDPLGNVHKTRNLLWDGDFEWRPSFQDQYGWLYGDGGAPITFAMPPLVIGAACRSGVKCTRLQDNDIILGLAVASEGNDLAVSVWSAPEDGACADLQVLLVSQSAAEGAQTVDPVNDRADEDGWCQHSGIVPERQTAQYLYIENQNAPAIVDDVSIEPAEAQAKRFKSLSAPPDAQKVARIRAWGRAAAQPRLVPPSEGEKRFERHMRRRWGIGR